MARSLGGVCLATGCSLALLAGMTGCQTTQTASTLPPPNFNPPKVSGAWQSGGAAASGGAGRQSLPPSYTLSPLPPMVNGVPRDWIPRERPRKWLWIVIHHTATPSGSLARIDVAHRAKGWEHGAGYDFVVGNGTDSRNGQVEVSPRWVQQIDGAHTHTPDQRFNKLGIGIVMVGNFDETRPSKAQMEATSRLVAYLMKTYRIPPDRVLGHRDTKATDCPGRFTNVADIRRMASRALADAGEEIPTSGKLALSPSGDLMFDLPGSESMAESR